MTKPVAVKKHHKDIIFGNEKIYNNYMERIKKAPNFVKKRGVFNNAESNRSLTEEMISKLHEEAYKASPSYSRLQKKIKVNKKIYFKRGVYRNEKK